MAGGASVVTLEPDQPLRVAPVRLGWQVSCGCGCGLHSTSFAFAGLPAYGPVSKPCRARLYGGSREAASSRHRFPGRPGDPVERIRSGRDPLHLGLRRPGATSSCVGATRLGPPCTTVPRWSTGAPTSATWLTSQRWGSPWSRPSSSLRATRLRSPARSSSSPRSRPGPRDSGRFGTATHDLARRLIGDIHASGRMAMVQPFHSTVDSVGETAVLCIDGEPVHALRKRAVLRPDEVAPVRDDPLGAAEAMYDPGLVTADVADEDELNLAAQVVTEVRRRFDYLPLYARVDMIRDRAGAPILLKLEAIEPNFYLDQVPATIAIVADAIVNRLPGGWIARPGTWPSARPVQLISAGGPRKRRTGAAPRPSGRRGYDTGPRSAVAVGEAGELG